MISVMACSKNIFLKLDGDGYIHSFTVQSSKSRHKLIGMNRSVDPATGGSRGNPYTYTFATPVQYYALVYPMIKTHPDIQFGALPKSWGLKGRSTCHRQRLDFRYTLMAQFASWALHEYPPDLAAPSWGDLMNPTSKLTPVFFISARKTSECVTGRFCITHQMLLPATKCYRYSVSSSAFRLPHHPRRFQRCI